MHVSCNSIAHFRRLAASLALAGFGALAHATDCWVRCDGDARCEVGKPTGGSEPVPATFVTPSIPCAELRALDRGKRLEGMLRGRGKVLPFSVASNQDLGAVVRLLGASDCSFNSRACRERRDQAMLAGRAGKAFDGPSGHKPTGTPCAIGLPCGLVLAPTQPWQLRIDDAQAADGVLQIAALRNASGATEVTVRDGRAVVPTSFVRAGASYSYALTSRGGAVIAAGQFSAAAPTIEADVRGAESAALTAGRTAESARLEALLANDLDWDVMQLTRR